MDLYFIQMSNFILQSAVIHFITNRERWRTAGLSPFPAVWNAKPDIRLKKDISFGRIGASAAG